MRVSDGFLVFVLDQLEGCGSIESRRMFGGVGLYRAGIFFGILADDALFLKVDDTTRGDFEREGMPPFKPYQDRSGTMQYFQVPLHVLEHAPTLEEWVLKAVRVAENAAIEKSARPSRKRKRAR